MNSLLLYPEELLTPTHAVLKGTRAAELCARHQLSEGMVVRGLLYGASRVMATVRRVTPTEIELTVADSTPAPPRIPLDLVVAVPRPPTVRKVLQSAVTFGVRSVRFLRSDGVQKSYLQSSVFRDEELRQVVGLALEQAVDPVPPQISLHTDPRSLAEVIQSEASRTIVLHTPAALASFECTVPSPLPRPVTMCIGPESGWSEREVAMARDAGVVIASLGPRMLRVEHAVAACCGLMLGAREINAIPPPR